MNDVAATSFRRASLPGEAAATDWHAKLSLDFRARDRRTVLAKREHTGPLIVQKMLHPEGAGVCQAIVVHPPGGIAGGDRLELAVDVGAHAHAQLTTPGASKWYRSAGALARQTFAARVAANAILEWLPQEVIVFDGARALLTTTIALAADAAFIGWDVVCLGRTHAGERFATGSFAQSLQLSRGDVLLWCERTALDGGSRALQSGAILNGAPVFGTMLAAGNIDDEMIASCRRVLCDDGEVAVTRVPHVLLARYRGGSAPAARTYFANLWRVLRPGLAGRVAVTPRIWNT